MNPWLLAAAATTLAITLIHLIAGHRDPVLPLLAAADLAETPKRTMHAVWHLVSANLALSTVGLTWAAFATTDVARAIAVLVGAQCLASIAVFLVLTLSMTGPRRLIRLPQWTLFVPVLALIAIGY